MVLPVLLLSYANRARRHIPQKRRTDSLNCSGDVRLTREDNESILSHHAVPHVVRTLVFKCSLYLGVVRTTLVLMSCRLIRLSAAQSRAAQQHSRDRTRLYSAQHQVVTCCYKSHDALLLLNPQEEDPAATVSGRAK